MSLSCVTKAVVVGLSPSRAGLDPELVNMEFVVDTVAL